MLFQSHIKNNDGKFMISMVFPNDDYSTSATRTLLEKIKNFEEMFLDDAVKNSESWFGEKISRDSETDVLSDFI